jgi:hypothetical protein
MSGRGRFEPPIESASGRRDAAPARCTKPPSGRAPPSAAAGAYHARPPQRPSSRAEGPTATAGWLRCAEPSSPAPSPSAARPPWVAAAPGAMALAAPAVPLQQAPLTALLIRSCLGPPRAVTSQSACRTAGYLDERTSRPRRVMARRRHTSPAAAPCTPRRLKPSRRGPSRLILHPQRTRDRLVRITGRRAL